MAPLNQAGNLAAGPSLAEPEFQPEAAFRTGDPFALEKPCQTAFVRGSGPKDL
jgi:hypothetical protein